MDRQPFHSCVDIFDPGNVPDAFLIISDLALEDIGIRF